MGSEAEPEPSSTPKLPLLTIRTMQSRERSGMMTPPLHTSASVPFRWEEEPGKPRPCTALITTTLCDTNKCLELPPRLQLMDSKMTKMPSPTTVLEGPYYAGMPLFQSSSFRFIGRERRQGSFGSSCGSPERGQLGAMVLSKRPAESSKDRGSGFIFGSWGRKPNPKRGKREVRGGSFDFSSSMEISDLFDGGEDSGSSSRGRGRGRGTTTTTTTTTRTVKMMSRSILRRNGSFSSLSQVRSPFWATIYEGFKQVLPWKGRKSKTTEGLVI